MNCWIVQDKVLANLGMRVCVCTSLHSCGPPGWTTELGWLYALVSAWMVWVVVMVCSHTDEQMGSPMAVCCSHMTGSNCGSKSLVCPFLSPTSPLGIHPPITCDGINALPLCGCSCGASAGPPSAAAIHKLAQMGTQCHSHFATNGIAQCGFT